ncbi:MULTISPECIES: GPO family capsid scaffolding protein [Pseudomonas]|uniref:GPO family capsid scaffolding protein n=1 Tax=Pseudomonas TaxID=286 RepID=UPI00053E55BA|nr:MULTISPECIES: GPO family capsid scaffolding protein [Pseudomonas]MBG4889880.1 GPO family capsid scaffolding protein [Pseudomonas aeruginosa]MBY9842168.1 GPO family capsid scaffolding protein [Pseudomonas aeruginosa]MCC0382322.1 GPO family capsid scaffolding protein [Pseudomonas aeruginosa]MCS8521576.1 GPO family capsid scaffolding protein [Pseudomonas aeruginosa]MCT1116365.1 GPO family capsid scaffolding protein [Pseudomonas aeruginosa]
MPRSLVSPWKRVAVSGDTVDGRVITEQELRDCAETYDRSFYTATIWAEHDRWRGAHGTVYEVRLVEAKDDPELEPGQVSLEARLRPNDDLLALNDQGKGLFSSIEIWPNFRNSGRCYLSGMAVTDEPASTRTQELYFSRRTARRGQARFFTSSLPLSNLREDGTTAPEVRGLIASLIRVFKRFGTDIPTPTDERKPMDEATATALNALLEQLLLVAAGMKAVLEPVEDDADETQTEDQVSAVEEAVQDIVDQAEEDREFRRRRSQSKDLSSRVKALDDKLTKLLNTRQGRQIPRTASAPAPRKKVLR